MGVPFWGENGLRHATLLQSISPGATLSHTWTSKIKQALVVRKGWRGLVAFSKLLYDFQCQQKQLS